MSFAHNTAAVASNNSNTTTADVSVTGVNSADAVQIVVKWEGGDTTVTVADTGGTDNFTVGEKVVHANGDLCIQTFYKTSATVTGSVTYRATFASARNYKGLACVVVTPDAGETVTLDDSNAGSGTSTSVSSGNIALSGSDISVLAAYGPYSVVNTSAHQINGSATGVTVTSTYTYGISWYARYTSSFTGAATCTLDSSQDWVGAAIALKSAASGGSTITPSGLSSAETIGSASIGVGAVSITPNGIASSEAFGPAVLSSLYTITASAIASEEGFGVAVLSTGAVFVLPSGLSTAEAIGAVVLSQGAVLLPLSIASLEALGNPALMVGNVTIIPAGIVSIEAVGAAIIGDVIIVADIAFINDLVLDLVKDITGRLNG